MRTGKQPGLYILAQSVYHRFHKAVFAFQFHGTERSLTHGKHLTAEFRNIVVIRLRAVWLIRQSRSVHSIHTELDYLAVAFRKSKHIVGVAAPHHIIRRENIDLLFVLIHLFLFCGIFDVLEGNGFSA